MRLVLHSSFSHPKADVTRTMGSGRLPWRPTGGRLKVSPPRGAQQMEAEVIICCSVHLLTPPHPHARSRSLSYSVTVLQRHIRSFTLWLALSVNTLPSVLHHANTLGNLSCLFCYQLKLIITVFSMGVINVSLFTEAQHHNPDTSDGNYSQRHSGRPKCSLPPIVKPLHFLINSKRKKKKQR